MDNITKLRKLIWDKDEDVFTDQELEEFLSDAGEDVYGAAALCLNIVRANPEKLKSLSMGSLSMTYEDLDNAIKHYENMAEDDTIQTVDVKKVY